MGIELNKYIQTLTEMVMKIIRQTHFDYEYEKIGFKIG